MACKESGVQIPSAPPGPMRQEARRPTPAGPEARYVRVGPELRRLWQDRVAGRPDGTRQAPMGAVAELWRGGGHCRLTGAASRLSARPCLGRADGWSSRGDIPLLGVVEGGADGGGVVGRPSHA